jgi:hypothetical protein
MNNSAAQTKLLAEIDSAEKRKNELVASYRRQLFLSRMITVSVSAAVSVLAGVAHSNPTPTLQLSILICSAVVTVSAAASAFWTPRDAWRLNQRSRERFRELYRDVNFSIAGVEPACLGEAEIRKYFERLQSLHRIHLKEWEAMRTKGHD